MQFRAVMWLVLAIGVFGARHAQGQAYPLKPIRIIVAIAAGSPTDVVVRSAGQQLSSALGQPLTIENRPGGDMVIGSEACARAAADGYTYCVVSNTAVSINPHLYSRLPYDADKDFKPVTALWYLIQGIIVSPSLPVNSARELRALASTRHGSLNLGTLGGGGADFHRLWLNEQWKTAIVGVPYKGANLVLNALMSGEIDLSLTAVGSLGGQLKAGKVKLLAIGASKRLRLLPDTPTYTEVGLEGFPRTWWGLFAPAGTPDAMVRRVNAEFVRLFREPKFVEFLENQFLEPAVASPEDFAEFLKEDRDSAGLMVRRFKIPRQ